jgi:hypothetical protein
LSRRPRKRPMRRRSPPRSVRSPPAAAPDRYGHCTFTGRRS